MDKFWTWSGHFFGYRKDDHLFTYRGKCIGLFIEHEVFSRDGRYIGEIRNNNRLITKNSSRNKVGLRAPRALSGAIGKLADYAGYAMYAGYEDFPHPDSFEEFNQQTD